MNKKILSAVLLSSSIFSTSVLSATPDYQHVNLTITPNIGIGYSHSFYIPNDNKTHYFYFDQNDLSVKDTISESDFRKNKNNGSTYFTFKQTRNVRVPEKDNFYFNIYYRDYANNNCLVSSTSNSIFFNNPSISLTIPKSNCGENKITYTISASLN